ncbi:maltooligosyl trehalose synthase [Pseudomonas aeruginosa]|nr:maltooligosyl trehalose synthase [Pseudomonas aeruginosa]
MIEPRATLRLQFHAGFTLDDALPWLDYFADLGISHLYASPLFRARPGSSHGYDVVDPTRINPELGGEPALLRLIQGLRQRGMGLLMDIVPNHMGIGGGANPWWQDVLEWGRESPYASFFDIQWESHDAALRGQVLLPFLRSDYGEVLAAGEIGLSLDREAGRLLASHGEQRFPLWPGSYPELLEDSGEPRLSALAGGFRECRQDREALREMQRQLAAALAESAPRAALQRTLGELQERHEEARQRLHRLLEAQHYRLASWRTAADDINWRRFFDISELVGLRVERGEVFEAVHGKVFQLLEDGLLDGLRIDHVDGLADPRGYCRRLRRRSERIRARRGGAPMLLYVEKILGGEERLPEDWLCDGTTGYDFMNQVSLLQHDPRGERPLRELWQRVSGRPEAFLDEVYQARQLVLAGSLAGDLENLAQGLLRVARADLASRDLTLGGIRRALFQLLARFPVYRTYAGACGRSVQDREVFRYAAEAAREDLDEADRAVLDHLERWLGGQPLRELPPGPLRRLRGELLARFQQLSSPTAAKAVEDTACYRSAALLSRNDVGFDPQRFAASAEEFHAACEARRLASPRALLATASHDHKRGEDARARLAALSELAPWFARNVEHWQSLATPLRRDLAEGPAPSPGDELILFQALLGSWPLDAPCDGAALDQAFLARMREWQCKALREAKLRTRWTAPDEDYERACADYLEQLLRAPLAQALRQSLGNAAARLMPAGGPEWPRPMPAAPDLPGYPRSLPGARGLGLQPGRPGQPEAGGLRPARRRPGRADALPGTAGALARRSHQADPDRPRAGAAADAAGSVPRRRLPALGGQRRACRAGPGLRPAQSSRLPAGGGPAPGLRPARPRHAAAGAGRGLGRHLPAAAAESLRMHLQRPVFHHAAAQRRAPEPVRSARRLSRQPALPPRPGGHPMSADEKRIREFAYQIWESEGCPDGQAERHWAMARQLAEAEAAAAAPKKTRGRAKAAKETPALLQAPAAKPRKPRAASPARPASEKPAAAKPRSRRKPEAGE